MFFNISKENFAAQRARELMNEFGLSDWKFSFNNSKRRLGLTRFPRPGSNCGTIELSRHFVALNDNKTVEETIRHEIAHALAFISSGEIGHGRAWKRACELTGATSVVLATNVKMPSGKWFSQCQNCKVKHYFYRKPKSDKVLYCLKCGPDNGKLLELCENFARI